MRFLEFILLKRNDWEHDRRAIESNLDQAPKDAPLWLVVFPEGTVVSRDTRKRSHTFAQKNGLTDHRHILLPRTSGLFVCINKLRSSVDYVYDLTIGYSGVARGNIPQELYPLPMLYINKVFPKELHVHVRRFRVADIPEDEPAFVDWVRQRWQEKDDLLEEFYTRGRFPSQMISEQEKEGWMAALASGKVDALKSGSHHYHHHHDQKETDEMRQRLQDKRMQDACEGAVRIPFWSKSPLYDLLVPTKLHLAWNVVLVATVVAYTGYRYFS